MIRAVLCAALALVPLGPARAGEPSLSQVLKRAFDAYGGLPALQRRNARVEEGKVTSAMQGGQAGVLSRTFERPRRLRVEVAYPGQEAEVRVLDGARGWRNGIEVSGTAKWAAMVLQAARMDLPRLLAEERVKLVDGGSVKRDGRRLRAVTLALGEGMTLTAEIDPETGRILRSSGRMDAGPGMALELATVYSDFRRVDGVLVPFREANFAQGQRTGDTLLRRAEALRDAPPGSFRP